jgi:hypothetical protein
VAYVEPRTCDPGLEDRCPFGRARAEGQSVIPGLSRRRPRVRVPSTPPTLALDHTRRLPTVTAVAAKTMSRGYAEAGYAAAMRRAANTLAAGFSGVYIAPFDVVWAYSQAGDRDRTLTWLVKAVDARDPNISAMVTDPQFDSLRGDARFLELLRRANLPS